MAGLGMMLDGLACRVAGHIWVRHTEVEGVVLCTRCGAVDDTEARRRWGRRRKRRVDQPTSIVPEDRPWLEPPFSSSELS